MHKNDEIQKTREYLEKVYFKGKKVPDRLWNSKTSMMERYEALYSLAKTSGADFSKGSILDVGCGTGEHFLFLRDKGNKWEYTGLELFKDIADKAKENTKLNNIIISDISDYNGRADWIWLCGVVTFNIDDWEQRTHSILLKCFDLCNKGVIVDFLKDRHIGPEKNILSKYTWPSDALKIIENITPYYNLKNDYRFNSFCVAMMKK